MFARLRKGFEGRSKYGPNGSQVLGFLAIIPGVSDEGWRDLGRAVLAIGDTLPESAAGGIALAAMRLTGHEWSTGRGLIEFLNDAVSTGSDSISSLLIASRASAESAVWASGVDQFVASDRSTIAGAVAGLLVVRKLLGTDEWRQAWAPFEATLGRAEDLG